jgi:hypothetical protein
MGSFCGLILSHVAQLRARGLFFHDLLFSSFHQRDLALFLITSRIKVRDSETYWYTPLLKYLRPTMSLQLGLRKGLISPLARTSPHGASLGTTASDVLRRWKSSDAGDVIGIDLGTTNSCVAIMVSWHIIKLKIFGVSIYSCSLITNNYRKDETPV